MDITWKEREHGGRLVTIAWDPNEDPNNVLNGLVLRGRLEAALRVLGRRADIANMEDSGELYELLVRVGFVGQLTQNAVEQLMVRAKDVGLSYGLIATALDLPRQTVADRIDRIRARNRSTDTPSDSQEEA